jgi:hypothetical protein
MGAHILTGRAKTLPQPDWDVFLIATDNNTILGVYGLREPAVDHLRRLTANYPAMNIRIIPKTYPFKSRPNVGDVLVAE